MFREILHQAWNSLRRQPTRSFLTMLGMVWGIVAVTLLIAYGESFRGILVTAFDAFGKRVVFEKEDIEQIQADAALVRTACLETVRWMPIAYGERMTTTAIRGVCP